MSHDNYSLSARVYNHIRDGILAGTFAKGDELKAVSYTHLDVYKRQFQYNNDMRVKSHL